jgi:hypothetical protein
VAVDSEDDDEGGDEDGEANCTSVIGIQLSSALRERARDDEMLAARAA